MDVATGQVFLTRLRVFAAPPGQALLAAEAVRRLRLPAPVIGVNPPPRPGEPARALVRLPTWLWLDGASWGQRSATASIPTLSVTATATAVVVVWSTGDGGSERCGGPGVPWREGMDLSAKPPCGHTYLVPSPPGAPFTLRATVTWRVTWTGTGGISGAEPDLQTTAVIPLRVVESQALNFGGGG